MSTSQFCPTLATSPLWRLLAPSLPAPPRGPCGVEGCREQAPLNCGGCQVMSYCSKDHQKRDWQAAHRNKCSSFKIVKKSGMGRHLVATRDILPGEVILEEMPVTAGPKQYTCPVCLGCYKPVPLTGYRCSKCDWPMCDAKCAARPIHQAECEVFSKAGLKPTHLRRKKRPTKEEAEEETDQSETGTEHPIYECVTPLRVCLVQNLRRENWTVVEKMETHREERQLEENSIHNQHNIVNYLLQHAKLGEHIPGISKEHITRASDVLDVNSFEIRGPQHSIRGLYPVTAMMNASCRPNTQNSIDADWVCRVRAVRRIPKGEEICDTYTSTLSNTLYRRNNLRVTKYFDCSCSRCSDPTEFGSHFSTLICRSGAGCTGYMLSSAPLDQEAPWTCLKCGLEMPAADVVAEQEEWEEKIEATPREMGEQVKLLDQLTDLFHPNHNMCVDVKFNLVPLFGRAGPQEMEAEAKRKEEICETLLGLMNSLIPGLFRIRGMFLVELYTTKLFLLRSRLEAGDISKSVFVRRVAGLRPLLVEAKTILEFEPPGSLEFSRLESVESFLAQLDKVVGQAGATLTD